MTSRALLFLQNMFLLKQVYGTCFWMFLLIFLFFLLLSHSQRKTLKWNGWRTFKAKYDFCFRYCGHGSGQEYLKWDAVQRLYCSAVALLMGCSSGKLTVSRFFWFRMVSVRYLQCFCVKTTKALFWLKNTRVRRNPSFI